MTIEQATVKMLSSLNLHNELSVDMVDLAIVSIIGYSAVRKIVNSVDFPENKETDLIDLLNETDYMNINELISDFLKEGK